MVFFLAVSTKTVLTFGAIIGGTVAILANKEKIMEITADALQKGADYLNEELDKRKIKMASMMGDGDLNFVGKYMDFGSEATTPETSDQESETDEDMESAYDISETSLKESFENIKEKEGLIEFERYSGSTSTLIGRLEKEKMYLDGGDLDLD